MKKENIVLLLVGPRGAGKTTYGKKLLQSHPDLQGVDRDEVRMRLFGSLYTSPYTGEGYYAYKIINRILRQKLLNKTGVRILLDYWTGDRDARKHLLCDLRDAGATRVHALYFDTPIELVEQWFWMKPGIAKFGDSQKSSNEEVITFSESAPTRDYKTFHQLARDIESDGFDQVIRINPLQTVLPLY